MELRRISLARASGDEITLVSEAYKLWREVFEPIMDKAGVPLLPESFHRSQYMTIIHEDGLPLSFSLSSFIHLNIAGATDMRYFDPISSRLKMNLIEASPKIMTIEWVTVHPKERVRLSKIRQPDLIVGCSTRFFEESDADAAIGISRIDLAADRIAEQFGFVAQEDTTLYGVECRVMRLTKAELRRHKFRVVQDKIESLFRPNQSMDA